MQGTNVDGIVSWLAFDTADFFLDGRGILALGKDDLLLFECGAIWLGWDPTLEAFRLYVDFTVDFKAVGFLTGAHLFISDFLLGLDDFQLRLGKPLLLKSGRHDAD